MKERVLRELQHIEMDIESRIRISPVRTRSPKLPNSRRPGRTPSCVLGVHARKLEDLRLESPFNSWAEVLIDGGLGGPIAN